MLIYLTNCFALFCYQKLCLKVKNLDQLVNQKDVSKSAGWVIVDKGYIEAVPRSRTIQTKMTFCDCQLHL